MKDLHVSCIITTFAQDCLQTTVKVIIRYLKLMSDNYRILSPVGQGGFDIEHIDGTTIVFDCGSYGKYHIENCIYLYSGIMSRICDRKPVIDYLFLSHFDNDHINGLPSLIKQFEIKNIIVPYIPKRYRVIYNLVTNLCVSRFYEYASKGRATNIFEFIHADINQQIHLLSDEGYARVVSDNKKWEWIYKSFFSTTQWEELIGALKDKSNLFHSIDDIGNDETLNLTNHHEPFDINSFNSDKIKLNEDTIKIINNLIGDLFGQSNQSFAKNENGLVMLSKKASIEQNVSTRVFYPECPYSRILDNRFSYKHNSFDCEQNQNYSACIYTGDMKLDNSHFLTINDFTKMACEPLLLFQIPHHGSSHNSSKPYLQQIHTNIYFWHDRDHTRINKNTSIITDIGIANRLRIIDTSAGLYCKIDI